MQEKEWSAEKFEQKPLQRENVQEEYVEEQTETETQAIIKDIKQRDLVIALLQVINTE